MSILQAHRVSWHKLDVVRCVYDMLYAFILHFSLTEAFINIRQFRPVIMINTWDTTESYIIYNIPVTRRTVEFVLPLP